ncbi:MAG: hypothetical protein ACOZIN_12825 [Myxococcota bacterium]
MAKGNGKTKSLEQQLLEEVRRGFDRVDGRLEQISTRLDKVIENTGAHWRNLDARVKLIEAKLGIGR